MITEEELAVAKREIELRGEELYIALRWLASPMCVSSCGYELYSIGYTVLWLIRTGRMSGTYEMYLRGLEPEELLHLLAEIKAGVPENTPAALTRPIIEAISQRVAGVAE